MLRQTHGILSVPVMFVLAVIIASGASIYAASLYFRWTAPAAPPPVVVVPAPVVQAPQSAAASLRKASEKPSTQNLTDAFSPASYPTGIVIVGVQSRLTDDISTEAAKQMTDLVFLALGQKGRQADEFRSGVYAGGYFDSVLNGNIDMLVEAGLSTKMHGALLGMVEAQCHDSTALAGAIACTLSARLRTIGEHGRTSFNRFSQVGAGSGAAQALNRAAELLLREHPEILAGI